MEDDLDKTPIRPAFLDQEAAESIPYPGEEDLSPTFDEEVPLTDAPNGDMVPAELDAEGKPSEGLITRYREIARLHSLGCTNNTIAVRLGYTASRVSILIRNPFIQAEIARIRKLIFDESTAETIKGAAKDGAKLIHRTILDEKADIRVRLDASKWSKEQAYGKAHQSHTVENNTLNVYIETMKEMRRNGEVIDVSPKQLPESDAPDAPKQAEAPEKWNTWLDENID